MSTLITQIIAIALMSILTATGAIFLSDAFTNNKLKSESAKYTNESAQIMGAIKVYESAGNMILPTFVLNDLVDEQLLKSIPDGWSEYPFMLGKEIEGVESQKEAICIYANNDAGFVFTPSDGLIKASESDPTVGIPYCDEELNKDIPCCIYAG